MNNIPDKYKTNIAISYDFTCAISSVYLSIFLRVGNIEFLNQENVHFHFLVTSILQLIVFKTFGLYKGIWRFSSTPDLLRVIKASFFSSLILLMYHFLINRSDYIPRTSVLIDFLLLLVSLGGGRFLYRILRDRTSITTQGENCLIVGAGSSGEKLCREIISNMDLSLNLVGFIDDSKYKQNKTIHNKNVLGTSKDINAICEKYSVSKILICTPSASVEELREIVRQCSTTTATFKSLPSSEELLKDSINLDSLRDITPEDLLSRDTVCLNTESLKSMIQNKTILVTGAGGSIGSELCNQICKYSPKKLICIDFSEFNIYSLERKLKAHSCQIELFVSDIRDKTRMKNLFNLYKPDSVFHAAAYKHVPIMEKNPLEAVKTNIFGTENLLIAATEANVKRFVLISSDKAVNPTNIMGTTKRIAELLCQNYQSKTESTIISLVRFGNVLGSSGSVIPLFKDQIESGGPLTITHPKITRYFMSIPEASQLVLQAGTMGKGADIFVLDMGEPFKIKDIAYQLIRLSGMIPEKDIKIEYTGLRPGEKLYEELFLKDEKLIKTEHPKISKSKVSGANKAFFSEYQFLKENITIQNSREILKQLVTEYNFNQTSKENLQ